MFRSTIAPRLRLPYHIGAPCILCRRTLECLRNAQERISEMEAALEELAAAIERLGGELQAKEQLVVQLQGALYAMPVVDQSAHTWEHLPVHLMVPRSS